MKYGLTLALMGLAMGCADKGSDSGEETGGPGEETGDDGGGGGGELTLDAGWVDDATYDLAISGATASGYWLGLAETGAGADGWYGEDCSSGDYCHPAGTTGVTLTSVHPDVGGAGIDAVESGATTLLWAGLDASITYVVIDGDTTECWAWGNEPSYYTTCSAI